MKRVSFRPLAVGLLACCLGLPWIPGITAAAGAEAGTVHVAPVAELQNGQRSDFIMGADVSELYEIEKSGKKFYDTDGTPMSALQVLRNHGVNYIRLRLWNDPTDAFGRPIGGENNDLAKDIAIAKEAKALGMKVLLDFHYSDFWADPGKQNKPRAWKDHTGAQLENDVYQFTRDSLTAMKEAGVLPDMVQIGNELNGGLLWPDGNSREKAAPLLQKASAAVRAVDPGIQILIHIAGNSSGSVGTFTWNLDAWTTGSTEVDFDIIGISDYPYWHGTMAQNADILNTLAVKYNKPVVVAETAYAWTLEPGDETINNFDRSSAYTAGYTPTPQGQAAAIRDVIDIVAKVPHNRGLGVFYWGAVWLPGNDTGWIAGQGSGWENQALFDYQGKALPSIDVFNLVRGTDAPPAASFLQAEPEYVTMEAGGALTLPSEVKGRYSDGLYKPVSVSAWDTSGVNPNVPGVYTAYGTIGSDPAAAQAVVTVHPVQPQNLLVNPGLEEGWTGWSVSQPDVAKPQGGGSTPHGGSNAVHYWDDSDFSNATVTQSVYVANGTYTFSAWIDGDAKGSATVPYLFAAGYDAADPSAVLKVDMVPAGWNNFKQYSLQVPVTSGHVTLGVNVNGVAGAWGDVDDFYFGLPPSTDAGTQAQAPTAAAGGRPLSGWDTVSADARIALSSATEGATIYYTVDGSDPGYASNSSTTLVYTGPIPLKANTVLKTMAAKPGYSNSPVSTFRITIDESTAPNLVPDGSFETAGSLGAWTLTGAEAGSGDDYLFDSVLESGDGKVYAGGGYFNYWSVKPFSIRLSQRVTGLPNGIYTLSARSAGKSNFVLNAEGRASFDPAVAALGLGVSTPDGEKTVPMINQGQAGSDWHNIWETFSIPNIRVTDGSAEIFMTVDGSADYWGYFDRVTLVKTADLPSSEHTGGGGGAGGAPSSEPPAAVVESGAVKLEPKTGADGKAAVALKPEDIRLALRDASGGKFTIEVKPAAGTREVKVEVPAAPFQAEGGSNIRQIRIDTGLASVSIDAELLKTNALNDSESLVLSVAKADVSALPADVQTKLAGREVLDFHLSIGGTRIAEFDGYDVQVSVPYTLQPNENPHQVVVYHVGGNGQLAVVKNGKYDPETGKVTFKAKHFSMYTIGYGDVRFNDIAGVPWAGEAIAALAARGAVSGKASGVFDPSGAVTRAEFVTMLMQAFDLEDDGLASSFRDVPAGKWYSGSVAAAQKLGIVHGRTDGSFGANDRITREEMAAMTYRTAKAIGIELGPQAQPTGEFADRDQISPYAREAAAVLRQSGILSGMGDHTFAPGSQATRAQTAVIIYRLFNHI